MVRGSDGAARAATTNGMALDNASVTAAWDKCEIDVAAGGYVLQDFVTMNVQTLPGPPPAGPKVIPIP